MKGICHICKREVPVRASLLMQHGDIANGTCKGSGLPPGLPPSVHERPKIRMEWSCIIGLWRRSYPIVLERDGAFTHEHALMFAQWANDEAQGSIFLNTIDVEQARWILAHSRSLITEVCTAETPR